MEVEGRTLVLIRLAADEQPVNVLEHEDSQVSSTNVLSVPAGVSIAEVLHEKLKEGDAYDSLVTFCEGVASVGETLSTISQFVKEAGVLNLYVQNAEAEEEGTVLMALMMGGFVEAAMESGVVPYPGVENARMFTAKKATVEVAAAVPLKTKAKETEATAPKKWTVVADDFDGEEEDEDMIDEDTLLDDTDEVMKAAKDDCGTGADGKRRACKNCTCGRKEEPVDGEKEKERDVMEQVSSCGNCYKGDAFRCGGCPFLGKPAFQPGMEKVMLNLDDADDM